MRDFSAPTRSAAIAEHGMAATSHPLATLAAIDVLRDGGNAVDAALAAAAMLCVVEPAMTGIGGDCFALYADKAGMLVALNGSGRAPAKATAEWYAERGFQGIPSESPHAVTVPGAVDAWCQLHDNYATRDMDRLFRPAIEAAERGYRIAPRVALDWADNAARLAGDEHAARAMLPGGRAPAVGDRHAQPALARTLMRIAREGRAGFYEGPVMEDILTRLRGLGGLHEADDFAHQTADWVTPIQARYRGYDVAECPPNGQGVIALLIARILDGYDVAALSEADRIHLLAEATKAAYAVRDAHLCDPAAAAVTADEMLADDRVEALRGSIRMDRAMPRADWDAQADFAAHRDTVYLCVVDRNRNAISFINSLFHAFGSCIMAPESGVMLHCRGHGFRTQIGHPNVIGPRKRPMHTIIPAMLLQGGRAVMPFGVMGGAYQATGHAHFLMQALDLGLDPQQAAEAPRHFASATALELETGISEAVAADLAARGHAITRVAKPHGGCQAIRIDHARGVLIGGSDPRKDGCALGY
ncbi:MAG: gamma-glutamyltransferase [Alphaproteobacteria bacterium]